MNALSKVGREPVGCSQRVRPQVAQRCHASSTVGASLLVASALVAVTAIDHFGLALDETIGGRSETAGAEQAPKLGSTSQAASSNDPVVKGYQLAVCEAVSANCARLKDALGLAQDADYEDLVGGQNVDDVDFDFGRAQLFLEGASAPLLNALFELRTPNERGVGNALEALGSLAKQQGPQEVSGAVYNLTYDMPPDLVASMFERVQDEFGLLSAYDANEIVLSVREAIDDKDYPKSADDLRDGLGFFSRLWFNIRSAFGSSFEDELLDKRMAIVIKKYDVRKQEPAKYPELDAQTKSRAASGDASVLGEVAPELLPSVFLELANWAEAQSQENVDRLARELLSDAYLHLNSRYGVWAEELIATGMSNRLAVSLARQTPFHFKRLRNAVATGRLRAVHNATDLQVCEALTQSSCERFRQNRGLGPEVTPEQILENMSNITKPGFVIRVRKRRGVAKEALADAGISAGWNNEAWEDVYPRLQDFLEVTGMQGLEYWGRLAKLQRTTVVNLFPLVPRQVDFAPSD